MSDNDFECIICFQTKPNNDKIMSPCVHGPYCSECFEHIMQLNGECSICRSSMRENSIDSNQNTNQINNNGTIQEINLHELIGNIMLSPLTLENINVGSANVLMPNILNSNLITNTSIFNSTMMNMLEHANNLNFNIRSESNIYTNEYSSDSDETASLSNESDTNSESEEAVNINNTGNLTNPNDALIQELSSYTRLISHRLCRRRICPDGYYRCDGCIDHRHNTPCHDCHRLTIVKTQLESLNN